MSKRRIDEFERSPNGFYATPQHAYAPLRRFLDVDRPYGDPCAGDGALCMHLRRDGFAVMLATDIAPRSPFVAEKDALTLTHDDRAAGLFWVTNPPWPEPRRNGEPTVSILRHLLSLRPGWFLLPADFMHNRYAAEFMERCSRVISIGRVKWIAGSDSLGLDNCCWYMFETEPVDALIFTSNVGKDAAVLDPLLVEANRRPREAGQLCLPVDGNPRRA